MRRVLIVDDSRAIRAMLRRMVTELPAETLEAGNGQEALDRLAEADRVDLALVDWNMPVMNGLEFVRAARQNAKFNEMQIVMVTTEVDIEHMREALDAGANEYIMKPFDRESLIQKLDMIGFSKLNG